MTVLCSDTFLRLPEEKRQRFLTAAWAEFTRVRFADTSINQIVRGAGISRGSFYQYFRDKEELLRYMLEMGLEYLTSGYRRILRQAHGDIFAQQTASFEEFLTQREKNLDPVFCNLLQFMRMNPGFDVQKAISGHPGRTLFEQCWPDLDASKLRRQDKEYAENVFGLCLMVLAHAVMELTLHPEESDRCRKMLAQKLEIIKNGSGA